MLVHHSGIDVYTNMLSLGQLVSGHICKVIEQVFFSDVSFKRLVDIVSEFKCARSHRSNLEFLALFERCVGYVIIQLDANRVISGRLERTKPIRSDRSALSYYDIIINK